MNNKPVLEEEFITLINSSVSYEDLVKAIKYLEKSHVLFGIESMFCSSILEQIEMLSKTNYKVICETLEISNYNGEPLEGYKKEEFTDKVDEFILERKGLVLTKMLEGVTDEGIEGLNKKLSQLFFERYSRIIDIKEDTKTFEQLENLEDDNQIDVSSAIEVVDATINGLKKGTITSIVGDSEIYKSLWAINIAYMALTQSKNVLYISLGCSKEKVYRRLLSRHSCDVNKFEKEFSFEEILSDYDRTNFKVIYNDFKNNYLQNLIVYDESEFVISTHYNLQKLIIKSQNIFREKTGNEIDLIIIDDFTFMKLDSGCRCITNQNSIVNEYFSYLKDQAQNLLGTGRKIPVVITITPSQRIDFTDTFSIYKATSDTIKILSDNVLEVYGSKILKKQNKLEINVLQSYCKNTLELAKIINVGYKYWYINYNKYSDISDKEHLQDAEKECEVLRNEVAELKTILQDNISNEFDDKKLSDKLNEDLKINF